MQEVKCNMLPLLYSEAHQIEYNLISLNKWGSIFLYNELIFIKTTIYWLILL